MKELDFETIEYFKEKFYDIDWNEINHLNKKGLLSDKSFGYLLCAFEFDLEDILSNKTKAEFVNELLFNAIRKKVTIYPFNEICIFYNQNSRGDMDEILENVEIYKELLRIADLLDFGLKEELDSAYNRVRTHLEEISNDWTLYNVLCYIPFREYIKQLQENYKIEIAKRKELF